VLNKEGAMSERVTGAEVNARAATWAGSQIALETDGLRVVTNSCWPMMSMLHFIN
jgi:hypothetical protein